MAPPRPLTPPRAERGTWAAWTDWTPLAAATCGALVLTLTSGVPPWLGMCLLTLAMFGGFKLLTLRRALADRTALPAPLPARPWAYLFLWPGMDPTAFLGATPRVRTPSTCPVHASRFVPATHEWLPAGAKMLAGGALVFLAAPVLAPWQPLVAGWTAIVGALLLLHFGGLHLLALAWQARGVGVEPLMQRPVAARTLGDFWSRWNTGFHCLARDLVFDPLSPRVGPRLAVLATFLFSGLVHDLVISVPARGGYGLPSLYFLLQGAGVLLERSRVGRRLARDARGRAALRVAALATVAIPAPLLFHEPFVLRVALPMVELVAPWATAP